LSLGKGEESRTSLPTLSSFINRRGGLAPRSVFLPKVLQGEEQQKPQGRRGVLTTRRREKKKGRGRLCEVIDVKKGRNASFLLSTGNETGGKNPEIGGSTPKKRRGLPTAGEGERKNQFKEKGGLVKFSAKGRSEVCREEMIRKKKGRGESVSLHQRPRKRREQGALILSYVQGGGERRRGLLTSGPGRGGGNRNWCP